MNPRPTNCEADTLTTTPLHCRLILICILIFEETDEPISSITEQINDFCKKTLTSLAENGLLGGQ